MIRIENMHKQYIMGETVVKALNGIDLHIRAHEFVAVVGPSGSGKSTLMNMLGCLDTPSSGNYWLEDSEVSELNEDKLAEIRNSKIGFVFQGFNLIPKLTALENVELPMIYLGSSSKERYEKSKKSLENVGLGDRLYHKPAELSGGQQQRVAIARALVTKPPIILADEPTGNLDSKSGDDIINIFKKLNDEGNTIILITHDNHIAMKAKRVVRIMDGKITEDMEVG